MPRHIGSSDWIEFYALRLLVTAILHVILHQVKRLAPQLPAAPFCLFICLFVCFLLRKNPYINSNNFILIWEIRGGQWPLWTRIMEREKKKKRKEKKMNLNIWGSWTWVGLNFLCMCPPSSFYSSYLSLAFSLFLSLFFYILVHMFNCSCVSHS